MNILKYIGIGLIGYTLVNILIIIQILFSLSAREKLHKEHIKNYKQ